VVTAALAVATALRYDRLPGRTVAGSDVGGTGEKSAVFVWVA
jgi:hypothetical protein